MNVYIENLIIMFNTLLNSKIYDITFKIYENKYFNKIKNSRLGMLDTLEYLTK